MPLNAGVEEVRVGKIGVAVGKGGKWKREEVVKWVMYRQQGYALLEGICS